jgi:hypothetical protein
MASGRGYHSKKTSGQCSNVFFLLTVHRQFLFLLYTEKGLLHTHWTLLDIERQRWAVRQKDCRYVRSLLDYLKIHDPSLLLFWHFVGYSFASICPTAQVRWAPEYFTTYCYHLARYQNLAELAALVADPSDPFQREIFIHLTTPNELHSEPKNSSWVGHTEASGSLAYTWFKIGLFGKYPLQHAFQCPIYQHMYSVQGPLTRLERLFGEVKVELVHLRVCLSRFDHFLAETLPRDEDLSLVRLTGNGVLDEDDDIYE